MNHGERDPGETFAYLTMLFTAGYIAIHIAVAILR